MSKAIPFETLIVGTELGPVETTVTESAVRNYCLDWDDPNPLYLEGSGFGGPIAPPAFMAGLACFRLLSSVCDARATIGVKTEYQSLGPLPVGQTMITKGTIADKYVKRGLEYVVIASTTSDRDGRVFRCGVDHILLSLERVEDVNA